MSFVRANDDSDPVGPEDPLYYAPRAERSMANMRSNVAPHTRPEQLAPVSPSSRFDEMREKAFVKSTRPLQSQFDDERRPSRWLVATGVFAAMIGVTAILAMVWFNVLPRSKSDPPELAVSISTPRRCLKDSSSFKRHREAKTRPRPVLPRQGKRPSNRRCCSTSSCSGSKGNSAGRAGGRRSVG